MKRLFKYLLLLLPVSIIILIFCACGGHNEPQYLSLMYEAGSGGSIVGETEQVIIEGGNGKSVTAIANDGYTFIKWSDGLTKPSRLEQNVTEDISVIAYFEKLSYTIRYSIDGNGTLEGKQNQIIAFGNNAEMVTAIPNEGYKFVKWSDNDSTNPIRTDLNVTEDITATAQFERITYSVQYHVNEGGTIYGEEVQSIAHGESAKSVIAVPNEGYLFVKWSDGSTESVRHDIGVISDLNITAEFEFLFAGGEGKRFNEFLIENYTQLLNISYYPKSNYKLANDLDLSGIAHEPIFDTSTSGFSGNFNGNGKTIRNLTVETDKNFPSLFGLIMDGIVGNLNLSDVSITTVNYNTEETGEQYCVGAVAGLSYGLLHDITVSGEILANGFDYDYVAIGGLAGMAGGTVAYCNSNVRIEITNAQSENAVGDPFCVAGLIGVCRATYIRDCLAEGEIIAKESCHYVLMGGLLGRYLTRSQTDTYIRDSEANVKISGDTFYYAGGFMGRIDVSQDSIMQITNCSAHGDIEHLIAGGFVYKAYADGIFTLENCYTDNNIEGLSRVAGFAIYLRGDSKQHISVNRCYTTGNISCISYSTGEPYGYAIGFGYELRCVDFTNCYTSSNLSGRYAFGFGHGITHCLIKNCFTLGTYHFLSRVAGFGHFVDDSEFLNCFSNSEIVNILQTDKVTFGSNIGGFVYSLSDASRLVNCYYSGHISANNPNVESFTGNVGTMVGILNGSEIINCHVLRQSPLIANAVGNNQNETDLRFEIAEYESIEDMYFLADELNKNLEDEIWVNVRNSCPQLKFFG